MEFVGLKGETLVKAPGSINGESFSIKHLEECSVFILDYSSEVEVADCVNCQIFIGPVDGPALFEGCSNCQVAVAAHLFKANACSTCEFGLYSSTQPALSGCTGIRIACWSGAYPGATQHFAAANLDPQNNQWNKVYDADAEEGGAPNFELLSEPAPYWEVPLEGQGPPESPVPGPTGAMYQPTAAPAGEVPAAAPAADFGFGDGGYDGSEAVPAAAPTENGAPVSPAGAIPDDFLMAGGDHIPSGDAPTVGSGMLEPAAASGEHPRVAAAKQQLQQRLKDQATKEGESKAALQQAASRYLEGFYGRRNQSKEERIRAGREALEGKGNGESGPTGTNEYERVVSLIDFNLQRPSGTDLSRFKSVLFTCKAKPPTAA
ncbi:tubulin binding cofactor [Micractinium conductrix]|uniref:Clathrin light chain n=1 Tax=Micractinium conductrix TaxID=554055 RepID=A0A2P6VC77_9CHLO|nr:tubulin binding cofactor [Micractinium conductrix]|eukprot:PSC71693.1 tubulin binding cofactor [Micractinium conductrix]